MPSEFGTGETISSGLGAGDVTPGSGTDKALPGATDAIPGSGTAGTLPNEDGITGATPVAADAAPGGADLVRGEATAAAPGPRRMGLRSVLTTMTARATAERALRAAEEAEAESTRTAHAVEADRAERRSIFAPFRVGLLGGLGLLLAYALYLSLDTIRSTLIVISVAALLAIGLDPAVSFFIKRGLKRGAAVAVVFLAMLAALAGAAYAIVPPIVTEIAAFIASLPKLLADLQQNPTITSLDAKFGIISALQDTTTIKNIGSGAASGVLSAGLSVAGVALDLVIVLILTLYFLAGLPKIKAAGYRLAPASRRVRVTDIGDKVVKQMGRYLGGATLIALQAGLVAGVFAWIVGLPYPWAIALAAAILDFVPVVGPVIVGVSMVLLGFTLSLTIGIVAGAFYLCQHLFEAYWLYPRVMRRATHISTGGVIVAILVGGALLGVTGALLAVPVAAAVTLIVREVIVPMQERS